jgi:predicted nucleic acid-binding protein
LKVYLETSAILYLLADNEPFKKDRTVEMYEKLSTLDAQIIISEAVHKELSKAPAVMGKCIIAIMNNKKIAIVPLQEAHVLLSESLRRSGITAPEQVSESLHIATALVEKCDIFISWDFEHIFAGEILLRLRGMIQEKKLYPTLFCNPEVFLREGFGTPKMLENLRTMRESMKGLSTITDTAVFIVEMRRTD